MTTATMERRETLYRRVRELPDSAVESVIEFIDDVTKTQRNAEYLAMLDKSFQQLERGEVVSMTFEEWEEWIKNV